jgi:hypothetical protein
VHGPVGDAPRDVSQLVGQRVDAVERVEEGPQCDGAAPTGVGIDRTPVVRNRLRYVLEETPRARRNVRRIVSAEPKPARRATASWLLSPVASRTLAASSRARATLL